MSVEIPSQSFAEQIRSRYQAGDASVFLLTGNIRDLYPIEKEGKLTWVGLADYVEELLSRTRDVVVQYDVARGFTFRDKHSKALFNTILNSSRALRGAEPLSVPPRQASEAVTVIGELITTSTHRAGVILDYFEMVAPRSEITFMGHEERASMVAIQRWSQDPALLGADNIVVLLTEHLSEISPRVISSPQLVTIHLPFPDEPSRHFFLKSQAELAPMEMSRERLAGVTAGLTLLQIRSLLLGAKESGGTIDFAAIARRKKEVIESDCQGLVEFVEAGHDFSHVGGMERIKKDLMAVAEAIKAGKNNRVPMGMIFVGPMGTGKTYLAEAFAAESGLTCLKFKNFRDKWVGSTEANLERVLDLVEALGFVLLIIDEADRSMSSGGSDGGTNSRVIARLKEFMSDTSHRGKVVVLMMTNRPDKLDADLKRPGRFDLKIPFFYAESASEREKIFRALFKKLALNVDDDCSLDHASEATHGYSSAELESVLLRAAAIAAESDREVVKNADLEAAVADVIPSRDTRMLAYMEMLAVFEASSRRMLPEKYRELETEQVIEKLDRLRLILSSRL